MQSRLIVAAGLLVVTLLGIGCDSHKAERASLLKQVEEIEAHLLRSNNQLGGLSKEIESFTTQLTQATERLPQHEQRLKSLQDELAEFLLNHKMATVALMATAGGAASIIAENIDENTRSALSIVGIIGALYCISNSDECADVTARVLYYGTQIDGENESIDALNTTIAESKSAIEERERQRTALENLIANKTSERDALKKKHDKLMCSFCF